MANITKFPQAPYFDDFEEENNFLRVLFRPGYSVQTRELNQLQSILQDQVGIISDYALENNSRVIGGETSIIRKLPYIKLAAASTLAYSDYERATFTSINGVKGTIQFVVGATGLDPNTLYVSYESSSTDGMSQAPQNNTPLTITLENGATEVVQVASSNATGFGYGVTLNRGIFYINKSFVRTERQIVLVNKYDSNVVNDDISIGFLVSSTIVKPENDISLLDNASGTLNESAPGAHRQSTNIYLVDRDTLAPEDLSRYTELMRIVAGEPAAKPRTDNEFAVLEQILARRTYDESGDYVVDPFTVEVKEHLRVGNNGGAYTALAGGDEAKLQLKFDNGTAYIRGFEVRTQGISTVDVDKARVTSSASNVIVQNQYKNSITCYNLTSKPKLGAKIQLLNAASVVVGTAFIRAVEYAGVQTITAVDKDVYKIDLISTSFSGGGYAQVAKISYHPSTSATYPLNADVISFEANAMEGSLVYGLPFGFSQTVSPRVTIFNKEITTTSVGPIVTISTGNTAETFDDETSSFIVYANFGGGKVGIPASVTYIDAQTVSLNISNVVGTSTPGNVAVEVVAKAFCSSPAVRTKTLVSAFVNADMVAANRVVLTKADAYKLTSVVSSEGVDVTSSYRLDTGARDTYYDFSSIVLKAGETLPTGTLTVTYSYFEHSASGDFFTPQSYIGISYSDIPTYVTAADQSVFLGSAVDYRRRLTSANVLENGGRSSFVANAQLITDIVYYMGRVDRVMLTSRGEFLVVNGEPSLSPTAPKELLDAITLYILNVPPYTFSANELGVKSISHRRYTMRDISKLDDRLTTVEEVALLSSLEREVVGEDFDDRFRSGFVVDSFSNSEVADFTSPEFDIAIDLVNSHIRPKNVTTFVDMDQSANSPASGIKAHPSAGITTLNYTERLFIDQPLASSLVRIQPFILYTWDGDLKLNPTSDVWFETQELISTTITNIATTTFDWMNPQSISNTVDFGTSDNDYTTFDSSSMAGVWNFTSGVWLGPTGRAKADEQRQLNAVLAAEGRRATNGTSLTLSGRSFSAVPFMRAKTIAFAASGLKPGTRVYPSFDGVDVSSFTNQTGKLVGQPLIVSGNGEITGKFSIPNGRFRTGNRQFKLSDTIGVSDAANSTMAVATYTATGTLLTQSASIAVTNQTTTNIRTQRDPIAQSFFVDSLVNPGGIFVSSIDVYLGPVQSGNPHDVRVELRKMINGYPAGNQMTPHAYSVKPANTLVGSSDSFTATRFAFGAPVYLAPNEEYAFVTLSNSEVLSMWCCELGRRAYAQGDSVSPTGQLISKQAFLGSMFISQNATTWTAEQTKDVKFAINRCEFAAHGEVEYTNTIASDDLLSASNIHRRKLQNQPLYFTSGSTQVYVSGWGHGFSVGDTFTLTNSNPSVPLFDIPRAEVYDKQLTVTSVDIFGFTFNTTTSASASGRSGGASTVISNWAIDYSYAQLVSDDSILESTDIKYSLATSRKDSYGSGVTPGTLVTPAEIVDLKSMRCIKGYDDNSFKLLATLKTTDISLSPVIYTDRLGVNVISNVVNNVPLINPITSLVQSKSSPARYIQKQVSLLAPANELKIILSANIPASANINVYYKVGQSAASEQDVWKKMPVDNTLKYANDPALFYQQKFISRFALEFQVFSIMVEFLSSDPTQVPVVKDYRALALNV